MDKKTTKSKTMQGEGLLKKAERLEKNKTLKTENPEKTAKISKIEKKDSLMTKLVVRIVTILLLFSLLLISAHFVFSRMTAVESENKFAMVERQLSFCQELVSAKYKYSDIITLKKSAGFAKSYSIVKYSGILRVGLNDISDISYEITDNGKKIELIVPPSVVLGNELLKQEIFDEKQSIFVPITTQEIFDEIEEARKQAQEDMIAEGVLQEAYLHTKKIVEQFMYAMGFTEVILHW